MISLVIAGLSSCASQSPYFNKQRAKYEVLDMHSDCPQLINRR